MTFILIILFLGWIILSYASRSRQIFEKYNLFSKGWHRYRFGFFSWEIKDKIRNVDNLDAKKELEQSLLYSRLSNLSLVLFIILYFIIVLSK